MIHTYRPCGDGRFSVGLYIPTEVLRPVWEWREIKSFLSEEAAAGFVNYLNGGKGEIPTLLEAYAKGG